MQMPEDEYDDAFFARFGSYGHLLLAILLATLLVLPFLTYASNRNLEPYPAIILPGGASIVQRDATSSTYNSIRFYGIDPLSGEEILLDNRQTIQPIGPTRLRAMARYAFNFDSMPVYGLRKLIYPAKQYRINEEEKAGIWNWLGSNLSAQRVRTDTILLRQVATTVDYRTKEIIREELTKEVRLGKAQ
jgi:hypothetical protein